MTTSRGQAVLLPARLGGMLLLLLQTSCSGPAASDQAKADPVSCRVQQGSHAECMEYVHPRSDLARTSIWGQCRDGGGVIVDACPQENLVGSCERRPDPRQPTTLSERVRLKYYFEPGGVNPPSLERLRRNCGDDPWTDGPAAELANGP